MKTIRESVERTTPEELRVALRELLLGATTPAFGALAKRELELLIVEALVRVGYLPSAPSVYDLIRLLRVSRPRARAFLYDRELRRQTPETLDEQARLVLSRPLLQNQGTLWRWMWRALFSPIISGRNCALWAIHRTVRFRPI